MAVYLCHFTGLENIAATDERLQDAHAMVRKRYPPCYRDTSVTIFSSNDDLPMISKFVENVCKECGVGAIALPIESDAVWAYGVKIGRCFEGSNLYLDVDRTLMR